MSKIDFSLKQLREEIKKIINEVLDEREKKKKLEGPYREYSKPIQHKYNNSKYSQLRIYFKCESFYYQNKSKDE